MSISKDESIVMQVAAKIAADLTDKSGSTESTLTEWRIAFDYVTEALFSKHGFGVAMQANATQNPGWTDADFTRLPDYAIDKAEQLVGAGFPGTTQSSGVRIRGTQHGPVPDWLFDAARAAGVDEVYDNRDGLAANPKRPHFKATTGGDKAPAFWPPRGR